MPLSCLCVIREFGIKNPKFHLTEVYAKTRPNDGWSDSYRQSGENMVLTTALAVSEPGVKTFANLSLWRGARRKRGRVGAGMRRRGHRRDTEPAGVSPVAR